MEIVRVTFSYLTDETKERLIEYMDKFEGFKVKKVCNGKVKREHKSIRIDLYQK